MIKSIFVDFGSTLVGFRPVFYERVYEIVKDNGYNFDKKKVFRAYVKAMALNNFPDENGHNPVNLKDFLYFLGITPSEKLVKSLNESNIRDGEAFLYDDTIDFLEGIRSLGLKIVLVSNATKGIHKLIDQFDLRKYFDSLIISSEVGYVKPNPKIFYLAISKGGYPAIHIGDIFEVDYIGAKRAFLDSILLDRCNFYPDLNAKKEKDLKYVLRDIEKLP